MAENIKTVVVLIQENRSFDHMLGWMKAQNQEIDGVTGEESNPLSTSDPSSKTIYFKNEAEYVDPDPGHSIQAIYEQVYGIQYIDGQTPITPKDVTKPPMNGFAQEAERERSGMSETVMNGFKPGAMPVYQELVKEFAICDKWFASVPSSTQPNRLFVHSATNLRQLKYAKNFHEFDTSFKNDCKKGKLPNYVVIEQRFWDLNGIPANDDHPSHDVSEGQNFIKEVYEALRSSPQWEQMLFIITYDEHGGFFDHVPTPVGVPMIHRPSGPTETSQFEHSSIPATVKKIFHLKDFLTKRDAWAGTFDSVLTRTTPREDCPETLPNAKKLREIGANEEAKISDFQRELVQMAAALNGDCTKDIYPHKLAEGMTVAEAAHYVNDAYKIFREECDRCIKAGMDGSYIPTMDPKEPANKPCPLPVCGMLACFCWDTLSGV
ncbi:Non-specific phospholipase C4 [Rhynchospora pubera]|uniref:Non-specific phospholipase C4 n=1 Tax=Rhynchospora pubera TaxID=906938 RepID=A0AAV8GPR8_9POAL|nr:Non-specific phospholipase C4 [Rhynchospora pubera]